MSMTPGSAPRRPDEYRLEGRGTSRRNSEEELTRLRERANSLLSFEPFVDWAGDVMVSVGFFGEGRELTAYQQGQRGKIVQEIEKLAEFADDGAEFFARVFKDKVLKGKVKPKSK